MVDAALGTSLQATDLAGEKVSLDVPEGVQPGEEILLNGEGMPRLRSDGRGNLIAHINVNVPSDLDRKERELLEQLRDLRREDPAVDEDDERGFFSRLRDKFSR